VNLGIFIITTVLLVMVQPAVVLLARIETRPTVVASRLSGDDIVVDGVMSETVWQRSAPAGHFRQQEPHNGEPATEDTEVRVVYDDHRLLFGVKCFDSQPEHLLGNQMQRDQPFSADDRFIVTLDTYADGRSGYYFEINPSGAMGDGLILRTGAQSSGSISVDKSWDGVWTARVTRGVGGWTAEIAIPFHTINFDRRATEWGINFQRSVRRKNEESLWTGYPRNQGVTYMAAAGRLHGLEGLHQGMGLDIRPYAIGSSRMTRRVSDDKTTNRGTYGGDLFYNVTPGLRTNLSVNTDFAETEVDQRQVNLTRFPLFFPEKRAFFLEGSSFFDFSHEPGTSVVPFFSRRIGLDDAGAPQPIDFGLKLTGQTGKFDIGLMHVRTTDRLSLPAEHFTVLRARRRFWRQSSVGALYTARNGANPARQTAGADVFFATSGFLKNQVLEISAFYLTTTKIPGSHGGAAYGARVNFPNDPWMASLSIQEVQDGYDPAVGFVERAGYRRVSPSVRYAVRPRPNLFVRRISFQVDLDANYAIAGGLETRHMDLQLMRLQLQSNDAFGFHLVPQFERLPRDFQIFDGVRLPAGNDYRFLRRNYQIQTGDQRPVGLVMEYEDGPFYSGNRQKMNGTLSIRPQRGVQVAIGAEYNAVRLVEGHFTTRLWRAELNKQWNPFLSLVNRVQFDSVNRQLGWQSRFRWIMRPGNDLFVVYAHDWQESTRLDTLDRQLSVKVVRTLSF
jgi:hypothetical protein